MITQTRDSMDLGPKVNEPCKLIRDLTPPLYLLTASGDKLDFKKRLYRENIDKMTETPDFSQVEDILKHDAKVQRPKGKTEEEEKNPREKFGNKKTQNSIRLLLNQQKKKNKRGKP